MMRKRAIPKVVAQHATCLIVDDSEFDREKLTRMINKNVGKMRVEVASTLRSARLALARAEISLILLDNNLPDGLGANFALELSRDVRLASIPVILVSDWPSPFMWEKAASAGVLYVLNKGEFDARYIHAALKLGSERRQNMN
jgi:PleD family two-component response regulator